MSLTNDVSGLYCYSKGVNCIAADVYGACTQTACTKLMTPACSRYHKICRYAATDGLCEALGHVCIDVPMSVTCDCPRCGLTFEVRR